MDRLSATDATAAVSALLIIVGATLYGGVGLALITVGLLGLGLTLIVVLRRAE